MKNKIIDKIDLLVEMSGTTNNYESLNEELLSLDKEIDDLKKKIRNLKKSMNEEKYFRANEKIIDENIKIGLENRLNRFDNALNDIIDEIETYSGKEEELHNDIESIEDEIKMSKSYLESLNSKIKSASTNEEETYNFYEKLIEEAEDDIDKLEKSLKKDNTNYEKITKKLSVLGEKRNELENKISKDKDKLEEICETLGSKEAYIDEKLREDDENTLKNKNNELELLEKRKLEIVTDPAYIANEVKELYLDDDITSALDKLKEIVTIVGDKPFMNVSYKDLDDLLTKATTARDEFATSIENRSYNGDDENIFESRIKYLEKERKINEKKIQSLQEEILKIDTSSVEELSNIIKDIKSKRDTLKSDIEEYERVLEENDYLKSPRKKATLSSALKKKKEEYKNIEGILYSFENDLESLVIESRNKETVDLKKLKDRSEYLNKEISDINKKIAMKSNVTDILKTEKDKEELKRLNDDVQNILNRKKYKETPEQIYNEVESLFGMNVDVIEDTVDDNREYVNLDDYVIKDEVTNNIMKEEPEELEPDESFMIKNNNIDDNEWLEVVKVIPYEDSNKSTNETINDNEEYLSFNDLLEGEEND